MRMKKMVSTTLALCLALTLSVPVHATDEDEEEWYDDLWSDTTEEARSETENDPEPDEEIVTAPVEEEEATTGESEDVVEEEPDVPDEVSEVPDDEPEVPDDEPEVPDEEPVEDGMTLEVTEVEPQDAPAAVSLEDEDLIEVSVPANGQIILDPYGLSKNSDGAQLSHDPQALVNNSDFPVTVNVQLTGTVPAESGAVLVDNYPAADCQEKEAFVYVEFSTALDDWADGYIGAANQMVALVGGVYREDLMTLNADSEGYFRFSGAMAIGASWEKTDTFGATLIFSFDPVDADEDPVIEEASLEETSPEEVSLTETIMSINEDPQDESAWDIEPVEPVYPAEPDDGTEDEVTEDPVEDAEPITEPSQSEESAESEAGVEDEGSSPEGSEYDPASAEASQPENSPEQESDAEKEA